MKKLVITSICCLIILTQHLPAFGWGAKSHIIIARIAETHLSSKAKKEVRKLLDGYSLVYYATWMDDVRTTQSYSYTTTWHYANVDEGKTYDTMDKENNGDVITATLLSIDSLKNRNLNDSIRSIYLKFLIHLIGDMHCPMHAGRATDRGGNNFSFFWNKSKTNLHSFWDGTIVDAARNWTSIEWATYIDRTLNKKQTQAIVSGEPLDWFNETVVLASYVYQNTPENQDLTQNDVKKYTPVIEEQFLKSGYRLAEILNKILK